MKLHELSQLYADTLGDTDIPEEELHALLDRIEEDFTEKAIRCAHAVLNLEADERSVATEIERLQEAKKRLGTRAQSLRAYILMHMERLGIDRIARPTLRLTVRQNPASVLIMDESAIPQGYLRIREPEPDKAAAAKAMRNGENVPGFAWAPPKKRLEIR